MEAILETLALVAGFILMIWLGRHYFASGDLSDCLAAIMTPWPFSLFRGTFGEDMAKSFKMQVFVLFIGLLYLGIRYGLLWGWEKLNMAGSVV